MSAASFSKVSSASLRNIKCHTSFQHSLHVSAFVRRKSPAKVVRVVSNQAYETSSPSGKRVLRYPNGEERLIRYPQTMEVPSMDPSEDDEIWEVEWSGSNMHEPDFPPVVPVAHTSIDPQDVRNHQQEVPVETEEESELEDETESEAVGSNTSNMPLSAGAFVRWAQQQETEEQVQARKQVWEQARASYELLESDPYTSGVSKEEGEGEGGAEAQDLSVPSQLHVVVRVAGDQAELLTLRVKLRNTKVEDDLSKLLKPKAGKQPIISFGQMRDGVVAFEDLDEAERFCTLLEAEDGWVSSSEEQQLDLVSVKPGELFSLTEPAQTLVVLFRDGNLAPMPELLVKCLKGADEEDEF